jgi:flagellum-specific peptidoglycan hydrolase FlgJ
MKKLVFIAIVFVGLLSSCSASKRAASSSVNRNVKSLSEKEKNIYAESDIFFQKFKNNNSSLNQYTIAYIEKYKNIAIEKMIMYKIPASITLAQGILESGNGRSELSRKSNNHFGIKCHKDWKGKKVRYDDDRRRECFRKYANPEGSFDDHSLFLTTRSRYTSLFDLKQDNYKGWARGLKKAGYATDRKYPSKLIHLIEGYDLFEYDKLVLKSKTKRYNDKRKSAVTYIVVSKGDTLYSIARNNNLTVEELKKYNQLISNEISIGQKLYLTK